MKSTLEKQSSLDPNGPAALLNPGLDEVVLKVAYFGIEGNLASAVVQATGEEITHVRAGDRVVLLEGESDPGPDITEPGTDELCLRHPGSRVLPLPESVSLKHGALIEIVATAIHAVNSAKAEEGEICVVAGGDPLGLVTGYLLRNRGAHVILADTNRFRLDLLNNLGFATLDQVCEDIEGKIRQLSNEKMADVVFQFSGSGEKAGSLVKLLNTRGRLVLGANPGESPVSLDLFRFFWSELRIIGAGRYGRSDLDEAIRLAAAKEIPMDFLVTRVGHLKDYVTLFERMRKDPGRMQYLVNCL